MHVFQTGLSIISSVIEVLWIGIIDCIIYGWYCATILHVCLATFSLLQQPKAYFSCWIPSNKLHYTAFVLGQNKLAVVSFLQSMDKKQSSCLNNLITSSYWASSVSVAGEICNFA